MATAKAEYTDSTGGAEAFSVEHAVAGSLVEALEAVKTEFNARLTALIDAEKDGEDRHKRQKAE
ncbi:hypothetical protein H4R18_005300 [Coemansia javaensis]|uniref:Uncharacterized protein n=1 Tax=Coemansia javaensis TaxID=2761396 RepID=A0A9W8LDJ7_9FUNG|nr:hypothetical protein H4R18_005300 [Coemansia javaensis]